ncbi:EAL domain-containing protein [Amphritea balenae]|uniref:cyclic-guanylate-specific phosphodiesterase n=1 Tax=Amphritea balenae TaxID=452629 RepID=A0A3P1SLU9_9GAMM|nr:EAL domain-containing protein [Amphritea balenae]RRC97929.1 EAL domain-containing protein [Amphritea balenae]GGK81850.1 hypothetical protein GCM10007941_35340 [Amphritea balenae]
MQYSLVTLDKICNVDVLNAQPTDSVPAILQRMRSAKVSSMVIVEQNIPIGIITERDIVRLVAQSGQKLTSLCAEQIMTAPVKTLPYNFEFEQAYELMQQEQLRHIVVTDQTGGMYGIVTETDFVQNLGFEYLAEAKSVESVMEKTVIFITSDSSLAKAFKLMNECKISCVIIGSESCAEGILSERDLVRLLDDKVDLETSQAGDYMSSPVTSIVVDASLLEARRLMQEQHIRRLTVTNSQEQIIGLLTRQNMIDRMQSHFIGLMRDAIESLNQQLQNSRYKVTHYRGYFENSPLAYQSLDSQGHFVEVNACWRELLGYQSAEIIGSSFKAILSDGDADRFDKCFNLFKTTGKISDAIYRLNTKAGNEIEIQFDGQIVRDDKGNFIQTHCLLTNLTEQRQLDSQLRVFRQLIDSSNDALLVLDAQSAQVLDMNQETCRYLGYSREELLQMQVMDFNDLIPTIEQWHSKREEIRKSNEGIVFEATHRTRTQKDIPVEISSTMLEINGRELIISTVRDITERKRAELRSKEESQFLQSVIDCIGDPVMVINTDHQVIKANRAAIDYYFEGKSEGNKRCYESVHACSMPCNRVGVQCPLDEVSQTRRSTRIIHEHKNKAGEQRTFELMASPLYDSDGEITGIVESSRDITDHIDIQKALREKEKSLDHLAHHDPLTQLPNRLLFTDRLNQALRAAKRNNSGVALLFIDLDEFKEINDSFGHNLGDRLLQQVSLRLREQVRDSDTIARLGGDEFTVISTDLNRPEDAAIVAQNLLDAFKEPVQIEQQRFHVSLSIGISLFPEDADTSEALIRNADTAMYRAKASGKNRYDFYTQDMTDQAFERVLMISALRNAIEQEQFVLHYQPQIDLRTNKIVGAEALIRWQDSSLGLIEPERFIPMAEKSGLIRDIDLWVLNTVCSNIVSWQKQGYKLPRISINISARHFGSNSLASEVTEILKRHNCDSEMIELEVTESVILSNPGRASYELKQLREMGIHLAIDDFGTGYSSLSYLKALPLNRLKIDRSFISDIPEDKDDQAISRSIIALAGSLGLEVMAEGMETELQREFLIEEGCNFAQGFLFSKGVEENTFLNLLQQH